MNRKVSTLAENVAEAGAACLFTMAQGNILAIGVSHWIIASQTGLAAGTASLVALTLAKTENRWAVAGILGTITAVVDFFIHPAMAFGRFTEPALTGLGAAVLSLIVHELATRYQRRKNAAEQAAG